MAIRPVFQIGDGKNSLIEQINIEFEFHNGMAVSQKQKSINSLHKAAKDVGINHILEVSTKSEVELGNKLSAFNLKYFSNQMKKSITLEAAFQGSKVFENDGPHIDLYTKEPFEIKKDERISKEKKIIGFDFEGVKWESEPKTAFYDWIYLKAVKRNIEDSQNPIFEKLLNYSAFTDIEFNPKKSVNCQARSCALYVSLARNNILDIALKSKDSFLDILSIDSFYKVEKNDLLKQEKFNLEI